MVNVLKIFLGIVLVCILIAIFGVIINDGSEIIANLGNHILNLFKSADLHPGRSGFNEFIQLIAMAVFVGWAINRFKK
jgi:hypothetical protein